MKTVCAKEYVDLKFDHIECGVTELATIQPSTAHFFIIKTKYPHDTSKPVIIARYGGGNGWANLIPMFNEWIDSTHFRIAVWNNFNTSGLGAYAWLCF